MISETAETFIRQAFADGVVDAGLLRAFERCVGFAHAWRIYQHTGIDAEKVHRLARSMASSSARIDQRDVVAMRKVGSSKRRHDHAASAGRTVTVPGIRAGLYLSPKSRPPPPPPSPVV